MLPTPAEPAVPAQPNKPDPAFVWQYVLHEDPDARAELAKQFGVDLPRVESTKAFMAAVYEAQKELIRYKAMAMLLVNQDDMFDSANGSDSLADKTTLHSALLRVTQLDKTEAAGPGGSGFVLNINIPGAGAVTLAASAEPETVEAEVVEKPRRRKADTVEAEGKRLMNEIEQG